MEKRLAIGNYLIIQQEDSIKINGVGMNEVLIFDKTTLECEVFNWLSKTKCDNLLIKEKKIGSYILKRAGEIQQTGVSTAIIYGMLFGIGSEKGTNVKYNIKLKFYEHAIKIKIGVDAHSLKNGQKRIKFVFQKEAGERVFGLGDQYSAFDLTDQTIRIYTKNVFSTKETISTLSPMSVFSTSKNRGFIIDSNSILDIATGNKNKNVSISVWDTTVSFHVCFATSITKVVQMQNKILGCSSHLPRWSFGTVIGVEGGRKAVEKEIEKCIKEKIKIDAIWIKDWQGVRGRDSEKVAWWHCSPDENLYPDFKNWVSKINNKGIKVLGYINPFLSVDPDCSMYKEAHEEGYFLKQSDGSDYVSRKLNSANSPFCQIDLSNESAYEWLKQILRKNMVENGFSGWFSDYTKYTPFDAVNYKGNIIQYHCELPLLWAKLNTEVFEDVDSDFFMPQKKVNLNFDKDTAYLGARNLFVTKYKKLSKAITEIINSGMSGLLVNYISIDKTCQNNVVFNKKSFSVDELYRWCEFVMFTPMYSISNLSSLLTGKNKELSYKIVARFAQIHEKLVKYIEFTKQEAINEGLPIIRPLFLQFPDDVQSWKIKYQYMLGDSLMVAPVIKKNVEKWKVWLPAGNWQHVWTKMRYSSTGEYVQICAPVGYPPVFINLNAGRAEELKGIF
ncbi:MAG: hypothetical protein BKP49_10325 [Treponema sp. CETP13]|nr:MAG: hypothetical protein BKP49_10325 [Treponema sp. CETP13]